MKPQIHKELIKAVDTYLAARAVAEVTRKDVDAVAAEILSETEYFTESRGRRTTKGGERITTNKAAWLMNDADYKKFATELDKRERAAGIKPDNMDFEICPALSAEMVLCDAQHEVINQAGAMLKAMNHTAPEVNDLLCRKDGLKTYQHYTDLVVKMVLAYKAGR